MQGRGEGSEMLSRGASSWLGRGAFKWDVGGIGNWGTSISMGYDCLWISGKSRRTDLGRRDEA